VGCHNLKRLHNLHNSAEVERLQEEHLGEDDLIEDHRTKKELWDHMRYDTGVNAMLFLR
jgi:hypothetical protein